jgi:DNA invertase Pin-like site-specific DNA recombinase
MSGEDLLPALDQLGRDLSRLRAEVVRLRKLARVRTCRHGTTPTGPSTVKPLTVTRAQVEAARDRLASEGRWHGYDSIAKDLNVDRSTVRRRLRGD